VVYVGNLFFLIYKLKSDICRHCRASCDQTTATSTDWPTEANVWSACHGCRWREIWRRLECARPKV